ncbi:MAG: hypothetical protein QNK24_02880, partial [Desulfuromusa sp.]|nr:hypothetical protein [Desulfuromusa sp.]
QIPLIGFYYRYDSLYPSLLFSRFSNEQSFCSNESLPSGPVIHAKQPDLHHQPRASGFQFHRPGEGQLWVFIYTVAAIFNAT